MTGTNESDAAGVGAGKEGAPQAVTDAAATPTVAALAESGLFLGRVAFRAGRFGTKTAWNTLRSAASVPGIAAAYLKHRTPIHLVAHSQACIDARYLTAPEGLGNWKPFASGRWGDDVAELTIADCIASVTTIAGPHNGVLIADDTRAVNEFERSDNDGFVPLGSAVAPRRDGVAARDVFVGNLLLDPIGPTTPLDTNGRWTHLGTVYADHINQIGIPVSMPRNAILGHLPMYHGIARYLAGELRPEVRLHPDGRWRVPREVPMLPQLEPKEPVTGASARA